MTTSLIDKVRVTTVLILVLVGFTTGFLINENVKSIEIERTKNIVSNIAALRAEQNLDESLFTSPNYERDSFVWKSFFDKNLKTSELIRIKVWDNNAVVIYSDNPEIVGKQFPDNKEFQEAIEGEVVAEIKTPLGEENIGEISYRQLMEIYTPIVFVDGQKPSGVIELYYSMDNINNSLYSLNILIWLIIAAGVLVSVLSTYILLKQILKP